MRTVQGVLAAAVFLCASVSVAADPPTLVPGKKVTVRLEDPSAHRFLVSVKAGERVAIDVRALEAVAVWEKLEVQVFKLPEDKRIEVETDELLARDGLRIRLWPTVSSQYRVMVACDCEGAGEVTLNPVTTRAPRVRPLKDGDWVRSTVRDGDARSDEPPFGHLYETWKFNGTAGQEIVALLDSVGNFDHLELRRPDDFPVRLTLDEESGLMKATLPVTGEYSLQAHLEREGHYLLYFNRRTITQFRFDTVRLIPGEPHLRRLDAEGDGEWVAGGSVYFDGRARQPATLRHQVKGAVPHLALYRMHTEKDAAGKDTEVLRLVDAAYGTGARDEVKLQVTLPADSRYVVVTAVDGKGPLTPDAYRLELDLAMPPTRKVEMPKASAPVPASRVGSDPFARRPPVKADEDDDDAPVVVPRARYNGYGYVGALLGAKGGVIGEALGGGIEFRLAAGYQAARFVGFEFGASMGLAMNVFQNTFVTGQVGPAVRFGEPQHLSVRVGGGVGAVASFNGLWDVGPAARIEWSPFGNGFTLYGEGLLNARTSAAFFGIAISRFGVGEEDEEEDEDEE